jgi:hypothetical protein
VVLVSPCHVMPSASAATKLKKVGRIFDAPCMIQHSTLDILQFCSLTGRVMSQFYDAWHDDHTSMHDGRQSIHLEDPISNRSSLFIYFVVILPFRCVNYLMKFSINKMKGTVPGTFQIDGKVALFRHCQFEPRQPFLSVSSCSQPVACREL